MDYEKLYITGEWIPGASGTFIDVENPATREIFARVPAGNAEDVDKAAKAAHAAFPAWAAKTLAERLAGRIPVRPHPFLHRSGTDRSHG